MMPITTADIINYLNAEFPQPIRILTVSEDSIEFTLPHWKNYQFIVDLQDDGDVACFEIVDGVPCKTNYRSVYVRGLIRDAHKLVHLKSQFTAV